MTARDPGSLWVALFVAAISTVAFIIVFHVLVLAATLLHLQVVLQLVHWPVRLLGPALEGWPAPVTMSWGLGVFLGVFANTYVVVRIRRTRPRPSRG